MVPVVSDNNLALEACTSLSGAAPCSTRTLARSMPASSPSTAATPTAAPQISPPQALALAQSEEPDPTAAPTPEPLPTMEVRPGDTLLDLAAYFGVTPFDIAVVNGMAVDDYLLIGQTLAIPVPAASFSIPPAPDLSTPPPAPDPVTPPPTPVPTPVPTPYYPPSVADVIAAICSFDWDCDKMVRVASCESGLNPAAVNPLGYYGLFQINYQFPGWDDPYTNAQVAYEQKYLPALAHGDGLSPWPVCRYY